MIETEINPLPGLIRGAAAIARRLGMTAGEVMHHHRHGTIPTFRVGGTPYATVAALYDWRILRDAHALPGAGDASLKSDGRQARSS